MSKQKILVTGATGNTGAALVAELRRLDWPVRALVRGEDHRSTKLKELGAEVVVADMYDSEQLYRAALGTQRAYYLPLMRPYMIQAANAFAIVAREAGIEYIVQMSQWTSSAAHPALMTRQTWLIDRMFSILPGVAHTILNPGMFADNFLRIVDFPALLGIFPVLMGESKCAPISNEDMARATAALLTGNPADHMGKHYRPTGPALLSGRDMARIISRAVGHSVVSINLPLWMFRKVARMQKIDPYQIALLIRYVEDNKQGAFSFEGGVTQVMEELTGSAAEPFETTARRYAALPFAQQTASNRIKAFLKFLITPFYPGYNISAYERGLEIPMPVYPRHCMQDTQWLESHASQMAEQRSELVLSETRKSNHGDRNEHYQHTAGSVSAV